MATPERELLERIDEVWPEFSEGLLVNHCILATRVAVEVGRYFGFLWNPLAIDIIVFNDEAYALFEQQIPIDEWPESAWSVGCISGAKSPGPGWDGHLVIHGSDWIADLSATQFHRETKGIDLNPWAFTINDHPPWTGTVEGQHIYLNPRPEVQSFRSAPDWTTNYKPYTAELIRYLKDG